MLSQSSRLVFAGTPQFAVPTLEALTALDVTVALVLTQPDRPAGRGRKLTASPVKTAAARLGHAIAQPTSLADATLSRAWGPRPELVVVVAYGLLLPRWLLDWPRRGCVNIHASLLPRWRGAAPIQHAILAGDAETGVSIMQMAPGLDRGPVYARRSTPIGVEETAGGLHDRLSRLGAELLTEMLPDLLAGTLAAEPQDDARATYARKISKADAPLDWRQPAAELARRVRAFNPWPVAEARVSDGRRLRIFAAEAAAGPADLKPGSIVAFGPRGIDVATGSGVLRIARLQPPGGRVMDCGAYLAAHPLAGGSFVISRQ